MNSQYGPLEKIRPSVDWNDVFISDGGRVKFPTPVRVSNSIVNSRPREFVPDDPIGRMIPPLRNTTQQRVDIVSVDHIAGTELFDRRGRPIYRDEDVSALLNSYDGCERLMMYLDTQGYNTSDEYFQLFTKILNVLPRYTLIGSRMLVHGASVYSRIESLGKYAAKLPLTPTTLGGLLTNIGYVVCNVKTFITGDLTVTEAPFVLATFLKLLKLVPDLQNRIFDLAEDYRTAANMAFELLAELKLSVSEEPSAIGQSVYNFEITAADLVLIDSIDEPDPMELESREKTITEVISYLADLADVDLLSKGARPQAPSVTSLATPEIEPTVDNIIMLFDLILQAAIRSFDEELLDVENDILLLPFPINWSDVEKDTTQLLRKLYVKYLRFYSMTSLYAKARLRFLQLLYRDPYGFGQHAIAKLAYEFNDYMHERMSNFFEEEKARKAQTLTKYVRTIESRALAGEVRSARLRAFVQWDRKRARNNYIHEVDDRGIDPAPNFIRGGINPFMNHTESAIEMSRVVNSPPSDMVGFRVPFLQGDSFLPLFGALGRELLQVSSLGISIDPTFAKPEASPEIKVPDPGDDKKGDDEEEEEEEEEDDETTSQNIPP